MNTRKITVLAGIGLLVLSIIIGNILGNGSGDASTATPTLVSVGVPVISSSTDQVTTRITFTGNVIPADKIDIYSEVPGILKDSKHDFKPGTAVIKGDIILQMDDSEFIQSLYAQRSRFASSLSQVIADIAIDYPDEVEGWSSYLSEYAEWYLTVRCIANHIADKTIS